MIFDQKEKTAGNPMDAVTVAVGTRKTERGILLWDHENEVRELGK